MNFSRNLQNRIIPVLIHLLVFSICLFVVYKEFPLHKMDDSYLWQSLANLILLIATFYLFTFLFLPLLLKGKKLRLFSILTVTLLIVYTLASKWISALGSAAITYLDPSISPDPSVFTRPEPYTLFKENFFSFFIKTLIGSIPLIALSFLYYFATTGMKEKDRLLNYKYTELIINIIVLSFIYSMSLSYTRDYNLMWVLPVLLSLTILFYLTVFFLVPGILRKRERNQYIIAASGAIFLQFVVYALLQRVALSEFSLVISVYYPQVLFIFLIAFIYSYLRIKGLEKHKEHNLKLNSKDSELELLKSQVNPHFLFNTLNTIYGTALEENAAKTGESISQLANLLRYMQSDIVKDFIPLNKEIEYLEDYIAIQQLRCEVAPTINISFKNTEVITISPGIFIPFVENAFKYGLDPSKPSELSISVIGAKSNIHFKCINSFDERIKDEPIHDGFSIGIKNTRQRLELVYPGKHNLQIKKENDSFIVILDIITE